MAIINVLFRMSTLYVGVDNGLDGGAIAVLGNTVVSKHRFEKTKLRWGNQIHTVPFRQWVESLSNSFPTLRIFALLEEPVKQMGAKTNAQAIQSTGVSFGKVISVMEGAQHCGIDLSYDTIIPQSWQRVFFKPGGDTKSKSIAAATRLFPSADFRISDKGKTPHDGFTDAALIAEFARRASF